jgi:hypothetical protein
MSSTSLRAGRGGPQEPGREWALVVLVYLLCLLFASSCSSSGAPKVYVSDPNFTCPGEMAPGAAVRGQADECIPYRKTGGAYIVFPEDVDIFILQAKQRLGIPKEKEQ